MLTNIIYNIIYRYKCNINNSNSCHDIGSLLQQVKKMIKTVTRLKSAKSTLTLNYENLKAENQALKFIN